MLFSSLFFCFSSSRATQHQQNSFKKKKDNQRQIHASPIFLNKSNGLLSISLCLCVCDQYIYRRMFPTVRVSFSGPLRQIQPADRYAVLLDIIPMDAKRYRYAYHRSAWLVAGKADPAPPARLYAHPDSPFSCEALRKQVISFEKVKLTNNEMDKNGQVRLPFLSFPLLFSPFLAYSLSSA